jgi:hypothetical protein
VVIVRNVQKMVLVIIPSIVQEWFRRSWRWLIAGIALMIMAAKIARSPRSFRLGMRCSDAAPWRSRHPGDAQPDRSGKPSLSRLASRIVSGE